MDRYHEEYRSLGHVKYASRSTVALTTVVSEWYFVTRKKAERDLPFTVHSQHDVRILWEDVAMPMYRTLIIDALEFLLACIVNPQHGDDACS